MTNRAGKSRSKETSQCPSHPRPLRKRDAFASAAIWPSTTWALLPCASRARESGTTRRCSRCTGHAAPRRARRQLYRHRRLLLPRRLRRVDRAGALAYSTISSSPPKPGWTRHGPGVWQHDASPAHIEQAIEGSLNACAWSALTSTCFTFPIRAVAPTLRTLGPKEQGKDSVTWVYPTSRSARAEDRSHRKRAEPLQLLRPRVDFVSATAKPTTSRSALGADGARAQGQRSCRKYRCRAPCFHGGRAHWPGCCGARWSRRPSRTRSTSKRT